MISATNTVVIAGGGTGGHIYPALAIARAILLRNPHLKIEFLGAYGGLETKIIPKENFPLFLVYSGQLHSSVSLAVRIKTLIKLPLAFLQVLFYLLRKKPAVVVGVGGYASGPCLAVACLLRLPTVIWEPNVFPGMTNRILARWVDVCLVVFSEAQKILRAKNGVQVGLPVRLNMRPAIREPLERRRFRILVFGGSQGARAINQAVADLMEKSGEWRNRLDLIHQTGKYDHETVSQRLQKFSDRVTVLEYIHDMEKRYAWADLVICRAGASTLAELAACKKASILIPLPTAADDHQRKNAELLFKGGAAEMILQRDLSWRRLQEVITGFMDNPSKIAEAERNVVKFHVENAAEKVVDEVFRAAKSRLSSN